MIKVLVTNDDGIDAAGLTALVEKLADHAEVYVAAPADQQSAKSQSITFLREVHAEEKEVRGAVRAWSVDGTPADCVKWAISRLGKEGIRPDFLFSGINHGMNLGLAAYYSGTIGAAKEGAMNGIRSIALSVGHYNLNHETRTFDYVLGQLPRFMEMALKLSPSTVINVNAPEVPSWKIKGLRIVPAAPFGYAEKYMFTQTETGDYQLRTEKTGRDDRMRYDFDWVEEGYATVSPLPTSIADPVALMKLRDQAHESECLAVIIDAQQEVQNIIRKPRRFTENMERFARCISRMNIPMLITETYGQGKTLKEVRKYAGDSERVERTAPDAWTSPDMERNVSALGPDRVVMAGALANTAVRETALGFLERGIEVIIAEDCCAATSKKERKRAMEDLSDAGCRIDSSETIIMELAGGCTKQVMDAVKEILYS